MHNEPIDVIDSETFIRSCLERHDEALRKRTNSHTIWPWQDSMRTFANRLKALKSRGLVPKQHQVICAQKLRYNAGFLVADDPGLGKTCESLIAVSSAETVGLIIVCPAKHVGNWENELAMWRPDFSPRHQDGKVMAWPKAGEALIVSWGSLPTVKNKPTDKVQLIIDEIHYGKGLESKRGRKMHKISRHCLTRWGLSGTICDNDPTDFYGILSLCGSAHWLGPTPEVFDVWVERSPYGKAIDVDPRIKLIADQLYIRRLATDVLDLPPMTDHEIQVEVSLENSILEAAKLLSSEFLKEMAKPKKAKELNLIDQACLQKVEADPVHHLMKRTHLSEQIRDEIQPFRERLQETVKILHKGAKAFDSGDPKKTILAQKSTSVSKLPAALRWIEKHKDEPIVVFSCFRAPIEALKDIPGFKIVTGSTTEKQFRRIKEDFQAGRITKLGVTKAARDGCTLTAACKMLCIDKDWVDSTNGQMKRRIHRIGQTKPVEITYLKAVKHDKEDQQELFEGATKKKNKGTIDDAIESAIARKAYIRKRMGIR